MTAAPPHGRRPTGFCPECGRLLAVRYNRVGAHRDAPGAPICTGSGQPAEPWRVGGADECPVGTAPLFDIGRL